MEYTEIPHGRIYKLPLKGPTPRGMTAYCDRLVFCDYGYKVVGSVLKDSIQCIPLNIKSPVDQMEIEWQEKQKRMEAVYDYF